jgi:epoxyqueuosine reductase
MPSTTLTNKVKFEAYRLGFNLVGVTTPELSFSIEVYENWLAAGHHGEMSYLSTESARQRRADPRLILPDCESILVTGIHYYPQSTTSIEGLKGRTAAYAWNEDYHEALKPRLEALVSFLEKETDQPVSNRWYTDTGPVLEREMGQQAGLGWIGKNSMLINPRAGSYILLAEILLGIPLEPDIFFSSDHCGSCTRCIEACPTECILPNRTLDARRCISYLTIELKGPIPVELRPQIGDWIFGCDICQQVCPWNQRFAPPEGDPAFAPRHDILSVNLIEELALTPEAFNKKFKGSPVKRAKRRGYLRNVVVALGNSEDSTAVPALTKSLLEDPEPLVRQHAAWALGQIGGEEVNKALQHALEQETEKMVLEEIKDVLQ